MIKYVGVKKLRFKFRLETVLRLKESEEKDAKNKLASIRMKRFQIEDEIKNIENAIKEGIKTANDMMSSSRVEEYFMWKRYVEFLEKQKKGKEEELYEIKLQEEMALNEYLEKRREKDSLVKLKERQRKKFLKELDSTERKIIDEVAQRKFWWKR